MKTIIYKPWDGKQHPFSLERKDIINKFMENIMKGMSPNMSFAQMFWEGFQLPSMDFRVMGLEEMLQELQNQKEDLFKKYNLDKVFENPLNDLKSLLDQEAMTRAEKRMPPPPALNELPRGLLEKIRQLSNFPFQNEESAETLNYWKDRRDDIIKLYEFYSQYADKFKGKESLDFDQALELMRQMQSLDNLQKQILTGQISRIDPKDLQRMLGDEAERSFNILLQLPQTLSDEGVAKADKNGFDLTPRGMRALGELAFGKLYQQTKRDRQGPQPGNAPQTGEIEPDTSRPYEFGDRFDLDITKTILNAVTKSRRASGGLSLSPDDFFVREREKLITSTTVILLDLSWSMARDGRFESGKKVALALDHYVRTRFPKDKLYVVGFSTIARELKGKELALVVWDSEQPFTNLQGGLRLAMQLIKKSGNRNNRVIVVTDGQPTAYYQGEHLHVEMPYNQLGISPNACKATLSEVRKVTAQGMNIETFMLDDNPALVEFTRQITKINRGRAVVCVPDELGKLVMVEEIKRRGGHL